MAKSTLYSTVQVLPGNKIEIQDPHLAVGETVEVIILVAESDSKEVIEKQPLSLEDRRAFLKLPMSERNKILECQAELMIEHYQQDSEWQELMSNDIIDY